MSRKSKILRLVKLRDFNVEVSRFKRIRNQIKGEKYESLKDQIQEFDIKYQKDASRTLNYLSKLKIINANSVNFSKIQKMMDMKLFALQHKYNCISASIGITVSRLPMLINLDSERESAHKLKNSLVHLKKKRNEALKRIKKRHSGELTSQSLDDIFTFNSSEDTPRSLNEFSSCKLSSENLFVDSTECNNN